MEHHGAAHTTYHMDGKQHGDTVVYKDEELLGAGFGSGSDYITQVSIWSDDFIYAIEVFYNGVSSGVRSANSTHVA